MKTFIKNVLLFLVLMIFVTMLFQGATSQTSNQKNEAEDNISLIEENIENGNIVNDGVNIQEEKEVKKSANIISRVLNLIGSFFISLINFFIKLVMKIVSIFLS
ncbi:MAG: hypothetical protein SOW55_02375 [Bacilli bacterium]|nr:hypothetical protein [Bacillales bacterium]MDY2574810.1 hypothetical protein [Bacilli bacterium]